MASEEAKAGCPQEVASGGVTGVIRLLRDRSLAAGPLSSAKTDARSVARRHPQPSERALNLGAGSSSARCQPTGLERLFLQDLLRFPVLVAKFWCNCSLSAAVPGDQKGENIPLGKGPPKE